jgi:hypothetical protein
MMMMLEVLDGGGAAADGGGVVVVLLLIALLILLFLPSPLLLLLLLLLLSLLLRVGVAIGCAANVGDVGAAIPTDSTPSRAHAPLKPHRVLRTLLLTLNQGFRVAPANLSGTTTQWPSGLTVAHSFDPTLFAEWGVAMGAEFSGKGANVQFGPGVNVARVRISSHCDCDQDDVYRL